MAREVFKSAVVIGAAGHIGQLLVTSFAGVASIEAVVNETVRGFPHCVTVSRSIGSSLDKSPEAVILTTPNPLDKLLKQIADESRKPTVLVMTSNGIIVPKALEILEEKPDISMVRGCIFTTVGRDNEGRLIHGKKRIALSHIDRGGKSVYEHGTNGLEKAQALFELGGFETVIVPDSISLEFTKVFANLVAATGSITGFGPRETFNDRDLFVLEQQAIRDRLAILKAAGISLADIPWVKQIPLIPSIPDLGRRFVSDKVAKGRNNCPPAAAAQIEEGALVVEASRHYHKPIVDLGRQVGLRSPVDEAVFKILMRHEREGLDLKAMKEEDRKKILLGVYGLETYQVHRRSTPLVTALAEGITRLATKKYEALGGYYIYDALNSLRRGKSVVFAANHLSHADHPELVRGIKERMGPEFDEYNLLIVAGMLFRNDLIMRILDRTYPHLTVSTLRADATDEEKWMSQIINRRSGKVAEEILYDPTMVIVYYEGSRSRNGKLQKAKPGASGYSLHPNVELLIPAAIRGTNSIWRPGNKMFRLGEASVEFGASIKTEYLKALADDLPRNQRDEFMSDYVMRSIAQMLPEEQRGFYS